MIYSAKTCRLFEMAHLKAEGNHRAAALKFKSGTPEAEEQLAWAEVHQSFATAFKSAHCDQLGETIEGKR